MKNQLTNQSTNPEAVHWYNKGCIAEQNNKSQKAVTCYRKAIRSHPRFFEAFTNLGNSLDRLGQHTDALKAYHQALEIKPDNALLLSNIGHTLTHLQRLEEAETYLLEALKLDPLSLYALLNLGNLRRIKGNHASSIELLERALSTQPDSIEISLNLALALKGNGQFDKAENILRNILDKTPDNPSVLSNLGNVLHIQGKLTSAQQYLEKAITLDKHNAEAHWNLSLVLLLQGDATRGWQEYEWREHLPGTDISQRHYKSPKWDGHPLHNKTLFLYTEQGCGDAIQFIRYAHLIEKYNGRLILQCQESLKSLFSCMDIFDDIIGMQDKTPYFDYHASVMSLPYILNASLANIPHQVPYIPLEKIPNFKLPDTQNKLKVGIVWAGNPNQAADKWRSIPISCIRPLFDIPEIQFYSLQVGEHASDLNEFEDTITVIDLSADLKNYLLTASVIKELDLVISVCTSVAHLAGALGKPVWIPLAKIPDWRWLMETEMSPWYPTARLFRQSEMGEWSGVIATIKEQLIRRINT